jgi:hypothetical protein
MEVHIFGVGDCELLLVASWSDDGDDDGDDDR